MLHLLAFALAAADPTVLLDVDATDAARGIFHVHETVQVGGPTTLTYPKWIPGDHGPDGPIFDVVDMHFKQDGYELEWHRDPLDLNAVKVNAHSGPVEAEFELVASRHSFATRNLARIDWNKLIFLPPDNWKTVVHPTLEVPNGWSVATALDFDNTGHLETTTAERLIDSPCVIGRYYKRYPIGGSPGFPPAALDVFTEQPAELKGDVIDGHKRLYKEAVAFFGTPHFRHYQFLLTFSDQGAGDGLEHNECSEDGLGAGEITNPVTISDLDAHEFSHSWCGKYRRPIGLGNLNYDVPMNDQDLWVYEGFTQFAGVVLSSRSGMWSIDAFRDRLAEDIDFEENVGGRNWRPIEDTAIFGSVINGGADSWSSRRRHSDYYTEMVSVWLEADGIIRRQTGGAKSIEDFCHLFFGGENDGPEIKTYVRKDLISALNSVCPYDWEGFVRSRVLSVRPHLNDGWLERAGWQLTYDDQQNLFDKAASPSNFDPGLINSIGLSLEGGEIQDVQEGSPADNAKLAPGMRIEMVDGAKYSVSVMLAALKAHIKDPKPIQLTLNDYGSTVTIGVDYHGGLKVPHLTRIPSVPDLITPVGMPHAS